MLFFDHSIHTCIYYSVHVFYFERQRTYSPVMVFPAASYFETSVHVRLDECADEGRLTL